MIRRFGAIFLTLPLAAALMAAPAQGQYRPGEPYYGPPDGQQGQYGAPSRILPYPDDDNVAPEPRFVRPYDGAPIDYADEADRRAAPPPQQAPAPAYGERDVIRPPGSIGPAQSSAPPPVPPATTAALPPEDQPETGPPQELPDNLKRQVVAFRTKEAPGTVIIDTPKTYLYLVMGGGKAVRYGIGVGRDGFTWSGVERISKMKEWPDWHPPPEMIERQPYLPRMMAGGPGNPLGARALYLGHTLYRIHGTNQPSTIGKTVSSGCIRLLNKDIEDLYSRVQVGTRVVVLPGHNPPVSEEAYRSSSAHGRAPAPSMPRAQQRNGTAISGAPLPPPQAR